MCIRDRGYAVNFLLPFHIGDIFRAWFTGRKMKNGVGFQSGAQVLQHAGGPFVVAVQKQQPLPCRRGNAGDVYKRQDLR